MRPSGARRVVLTAAAYQAHCCRGWTPGFSPALAVSVRPATRGSVPRRLYCNSWTSRIRPSTGYTGSLARRTRTLRRPRTSLALSEDDDEEEEDDDDGLEEGERDFVREDSREHFPRVKMDESPLPEYLVDMLRKSGDVDEDGKPLNDPFDPWDDEEMEGSRRARERAAKAKAEEEAHFDIPYGEMLMEDGKMNTEDKDGLMDTSISEAAMLYSFPLDFFHDVLTRWGVSPPINEHIRIGDLINSEQAFSLGEALMGLDAADVRDNYLNESLEDLAIELDMGLPDLFQACAASKINLPQGADTHITAEEYKTLLSAVIEGGESSEARRLFEKNLVSTRFMGRKRNFVSTAEKAMHQETLAKSTRGIGWRNGPPVIGMLEGELPPDEAQITGRIFGEEFFTAAGQRETDASLFAFDGDGSADDYEDW